MIIKRRAENRIIRKLRRIVELTHPRRLKLSPSTVMEVLEGAEPEEIDVVELRIGEDDKKMKHITFNGVPIVLCIKLSHRPHRISMG